MAAVLTVLTVTAKVVTPNQIPLLHHASARAAVRLSCALVVLASWHGTARHRASFSAIIARRVSALSETKMFSHPPSTLGALCRYSVESKLRLVGLLCNSATAVLYGGETPFGVFKLTAC